MTLVLKARKKYRPMRLRLTRFLYSSSKLNWATLNVTYWLGERTSLVRIHIIVNPKTSSTEKHTCIARDVNVFVEWSDRSKRPTSPLC
ncbi:hypothetical protein AG1IA_06792 [Rhizoctonia solani AG-1 IA]|uniref:Uncharacterized protein n=1 Tax=Thanatephorus cucumeris (strain AG1-IA) TaxID=983506 RepID=L8WR00_THACA|nr:hypothetical protein AG1IA_06792 [Rhizoctonia solani AG-1 IA]